jgi:hypothetical protein
MKTYRLGSSALVHAPGVVKFAIAQFRWEPEQMLDAIVCWRVPRAAARALLSGEVPYTVEGQAVVFDYPIDAKAREICERIEARDDEEAR